MTIRLTANMTVANPIAISSMFSMASLLQDLFAAVNRPSPYLTPDYRGKHAPTDLLMAEKRERRMDVTDEELVDALERGALTAAAFDHAAHGAAGKYHETITVTYVLAIAERVC